MRIKLESVVYNPCRELVSIFGLTKRDIETLETEEKLRQELADELIKHDKFPTVESLERLIYVLKKQEVILYEIKDIKEKIGE